MALIMALCCTYHIHVHSYIIKISMTVRIIDISEFLWVLTAEDDGVWGVGDVSKVSDGGCVSKGLLEWLLSVSASLGGCVVGNCAVLGVSVVVTSVASGCSSRSKCLIIIFNDHLIGNYIISLPTVLLF